MKKPVFACAFVLGASMFVAAQQAPPASTPPTFPSDQSQQAPSTTPDRQAQPGSMPSDTTAPTQQSSHPDMGAPAAQQSSTDQSASGQMQSIQGCISQDTGAAGGYVLTDASGNKYSLAGDTSKFSSFVGQEVQVKGSAGQAGSAMSSSQSGAMGQSSSSSSTTAPGAASTQPGAAAAGAAAQVPLTVQSVKKVADTCSNAQPSK